MNILLGITGSIASYKTLDLARLLVKRGHKVKVILTSGSLEFIRRETFSYLGVEEIFGPLDDFNTSNTKINSNVLHIDLAKWADKIIIAPASANTISKFATGLTNDLLTSVFLANPNKPVLIFPSMNTQMWNNIRIKEHVGTLEKISYVSIINPVSGLLACGDVGEGKFPEVEAVLALIETLNPLKKQIKKILLTAGATASPLDPVRYLTNPSTGKMGISVAKAFLAQGYETTLLAGHECSREVENLLGHPLFKLIKTPTTSLMRDAAVDNFPKNDLYISTGAIADIEFNVSDIKLKKETMGQSLSFLQAADILKEILSLKKQNQRVVSFAAETETTKSVFEEKMKRKPVDLMIGNKVSNGLIGSSEIQGFQTTHGTYYFVEENSISNPVELSKEELGVRLVKWFEGEKTW